MNFQLIFHINQKNNRIAKFVARVCQQRTWDTDSGMGLDLSATQNNSIFPNGRYPLTDVQLATWGPFPHSALESLCHTALSGSPK